jgi:hypothetical protein
MGDSVRINGNAYSWGSIVCKVDGERYVGFKEIGYGDSRERTQFHGMNRAHKPIARSRGKYTTKPVKLTGLKSAAGALRNALAAKASNQRSFGSVEFEIAITYEEESLGVVLDQLISCVIVDNDASHTEAPDPLSETLEIQCMEVLWDGKKLADD